MSSLSLSLAQLGCATIDAPSALRWWMKCRTRSREQRRTRSWSPSGHHYLTELPNSVARQRVCASELPRTFPITLGLPRTVAIQSVVTDILPA